MAALEFGDGFGQRLDRRRAEPAVGVFLIVGFERGRCRKQDGRAAIDRRVDEAVEVPRVTSGMGEPRGLLLLWSALAHRPQQGRGRGIVSALARLDGELLIRTPLGP